MREREQRERRPGGERSGEGDAPAIYSRRQAGGQAGGRRTGRKWGEARTGRDGTRAGGPHHGSVCIWMAGWLAGCGPRDPRLVFTTGRKDNEKLLSE